MSFFHVIPLIHVGEEENDCLDRKKQQLPSDDTHVQLRKNPIIL
jgi:hypothetical protein